MFYRLLLLFLLPFKVYPQNTIGIPAVANYYKGTYGAGLQNWDIKQDKNGIIYVANNEGLLSFDGKYWEIYPLPNKTIVRSVEIGTDNRIYVGGQDEVGYFVPDKNGQLQFHSLLSLIAEKDKSFGDVWDIVSFKKDIFFRSSNKIFKFSKGAMVSFLPASEWSYLGVCNDKLYAHDYKIGVRLFENEAWSPSPLRSEIPPRDPVTSVLPINKDSAFITTLKNGLYILSKTGISKVRTINNALFENERIYAATLINNEWVALATTNSGVYIVDFKGNIIQRFSGKEGLQNENVLSIFRDQQSNLWLGLDNGIDLISYNSAIKQINPGLHNGSGYTVLINDNNLFAGTSNGLYSVALQQMKDLSFSKGDFLPVLNTKGQVWGLAEINNQVLMGHHEGAFTIKNNAAALVSSSPGFWNFMPFSKTSTNTQILAGNYNGLTFFDFTNNQFIPSGSVPDFEESSRFVVIDKKDNIWVSHPYHGLYMISKKSDGQFFINIYTKKDGLPSTLNNHVYKIKNEVLVATEKGVFTYNSSTNRFAPSPFYKMLLGDQSIRYLKEDKSGNVWFVHNKTLGVADFSGKVPAIIYLPELNNKLNSGFEFIYAVDERNIFLGAEKGFFHINYEKYKNTISQLLVQVRMVTIINNTDSLIFGGYYKDVNEKQIQDPDNISRIGNSWKTIRLEFSSPLFGYQSNLEYSFRLKGFDATWSDWNKRTEKEYTNLPASKYIFEVKVRNNLGNESAVASYTFKILPPWYQTLWAKILYLFLFFTGWYFLYLWLNKKFIRQRSKYEEEQKRLLYIHELEINKTESQLVTLQNEKLEADINFKNSELASSAMHLVKKGELLTKIKAELSHVIKQLDNPQAVDELKKMTRSLSEEDKMDKEWENFTKHFDKVHSDFVVGLKEKHPKISGNELKLCAYLRMNLSTKEIAQLMNISVRGVEVSRYRLRKKLAIPSEKNLFDYLINLHNKA